MFLALPFSTVLLIAENQSCILPYKSYILTCVHRFVAPSPMMGLICIYSNPSVSCGTRGRGVSPDNEPPFPPLFPLMIKRGGPGVLHALYP
ncbi:hypothetical protein CEXT_591701 [Caerostris extrusa]|uniref:Secreted protein n=1 Tax=Caerostris extrusa TaxID=172846 RepID=A0AAV4XCT1_CAEEX|nr:hypothetical protein CEXT_591701 [Caerostris extrusa]